MSSRQPRSNIAGFVLGVAQVQIAGIQLQLQFLQGQGQ